MGHCAAPDIRILVKTQPVPHEMTCSGRTASRGAVWEAVLPEQVISCGTGWVLTRIRISGAAQWPMRPRGQTLLARPDRALKRHETGDLRCETVRGPSRVQRREDPRPYPRGA